MRYEPNFAASSASAALPARAARKTEAASACVHGTLRAVSIPWSERRPPKAWNASWRTLSAPRKSSKVCTLAPAAPDRRSAHALKDVGSRTPSALSGRNVGYTLVFRPESRIFSCRSSGSAGSSVVQMTATRFAERMSWTRSNGSLAFARSQTEAAVAGPTRSSIPK